MYVLHNSTTYYFIMKLHYFTCAYGLPIVLCYAGIRKIKIMVIVTGLKSSGTVPILYEVTVEE